MYTKVLMRNFEVKLIRSELQSFLGEYCDVEDVFDILDKYKIEWGEVRSINLLAAFRKMFVVWREGVIFYNYDKKIEKVTRLAGTQDCFVLDVKNDDVVWLWAGEKNNDLQLFVWNNPCVKKLWPKRVERAVVYINGDYNLILAHGRKRLDCNLKVIVESKLNNFLKKVGVDLSDVCQINQELRKIIFE
ncbi:MAG TPA: hypothetical protein PLZ62_01980 [bacterium]|nr:hypothetical protein [bacterium]